MPKRRRSFSALPPREQSDTFRVDDIDAFNNHIRHASVLTLLTLKTLEANDVLITQGSPDDVDGLTGAVYESLSQVLEKLKVIHDSINSRWDQTQEKATRKAVAR
jgi:hypothetical protein